MIDVFFQGPISVAVLLLNEELSLGIQYFVKLKKCFNSLNQNVTLSVVYPLKSAPRMHTNLKILDTPCERLFSIHAKTIKNYEQNEVAYPNNLLRNIAQKCAKTIYSLVLDIDLMPSAGLHQAFMNYQPQDSDSNSKTAWILLAYEIEDGVLIPDNKKELLSLVKSGKARQFYKEICWKCEVSFNC